MSKMSELSMLLDEMISCGNTLIKTAQALKDFYSSTAEEKPTPDAPEKPKKKEAPKADPEPVAQNVPAETPAKEYTKEEVRALLASKANEAGGKYKAEVRATVRKYGNGGTLTDVSPADYEALVTEMEAIGNAR